MNNVKNTLLLIGTTITLTGCFFAEPSDDKTNNQTEIETPTLSSLFAIANKIGDGFPIGAAVSESNITDTGISPIVIQHFNQVTAENIMKPEGLQPSEGDFTFDSADALIDYADNNGMTVHAHTLVWHSQSPEWMKNCTDTADCTDVMSTHITNVVQHFAGKNIASWDVVNEAFNQDGSYRGHGDTYNGISWAEKIGDDYINTAFTTARAADTSDSAAKLFYNDYNLEMNDAKLTAALTMIAGLQTENLIDGIGFQMHVTDTFPTIANITAALKKAADTGLQVKITELDVRMNKEGTASTLTAAIAETQKQRYQAIIAAYLDMVPETQRGGITVWGVSDPDSWILSLYGNIDWPLMFDSNLNQKPALQGFADALNSELDTDSENIVIDFEDDPAVYKVLGNPSGSAIVSAAPTNVANDALKVTIASDDKGYAAGVAIPVTIPVGKTLADYSAVTFKVYYTVEGDADIANKRIQLLALSGDLPDSVSLIQYDGTWTENATDAHLGVMDNAKADQTESTAFQTYTFDLTDGNVADLVDGNTLVTATKAMTGDINLVFAFPHEGSTYYIDDFTLIAVATAKDDVDDNATNIVVDFEVASTTTSTYTVVGDPSGSANVSVDPTDQAKDALEVTITAGYASGVAIPVTIPVGKTLADYSAVTFKVYYTDQGDADIDNKRIQLLALSGDLPDSIPLIQYNGTWADNASDAHLGVMDNAKADKVESTAFQTYTFDLTDGNVEDLLDGATLVAATKALTGDINIVLAYPHSGSSYYIDDLTLLTTNQ